MPFPSCGQLALEQRRGSMMCSSCMTIPFFVKGVKGTSTNALESGLDFDVPLRAK